MNLFKALDTWHKTRFGHLVFALVELGLSYVFILAALDSGSLWQYGVAFIFLFGFLANFVQMVTVHKK